MPSQPTPAAHDIIHFWFEESSSEDWFSGSAEFDAKLESRFRQTHEQVAKGEAWEWRSSAEGRLAEILVLDQFSRQLYRGSGQAFAYDGMAIVLAQELVALGLDQDLGETKRSFAYMPYMHSESLKVHEEGERLFTALGNENMLKFEIEHKKLIERFGRYPKRNAALGRTSTPEELDYIEGRGDSFF